jgi:hypothetical protein
MESCDGVLGVIGVDVEKAPLGAQVYLGAARWGYVPLVARERAAEPAYA